MSQSTKQKPVHEIRLGSTKATIWPNNSEKGIRYNVTVSRGYHDGKGWKETQSFGRDDLPRLIKCADLALYKAKRSGGDGFAFFSPEIREAVQKRLSALSCARDALNRGDLQGIAKAQLLYLNDIVHMLDLTGQEHFSIRIFFLVQGIAHDLRQGKDAFG